MMEIQNHYRSHRRATRQVHYLDQVVSVSPSFEMIGRHLLAFSSVIKVLVVSGYKYSSSFDKVQIIISASTNQKVEKIILV